MQRVIFAFCQSFGLTFSFSSRFSYSSSSAVAFSAIAFSGSGRSGPQKRRIGKKMKKKSLT